jgi:hypothetical protein
MKNIRTLSLFVALACVPAFAQTTTPSTTLGAAITSLTANVINLASITNVTAGQVYLYTSDGELMQTIGTPTNAAAVKVARGIGPGTGPQLHNSGTVVWIGLPSAGGSVTSVVPGANGFNLRATLVGLQGNCIRANQVYLPVVMPALGVLRDCTGTAALQQWVNFSELGAGGTNGQQIPILISGAITPTGGNMVITKAGVAAMTLAAPVTGTQDGAILRITSATLYAHTVTATGLLSTGTASVNVATFAAYAGAGLTLMAWKGTWIVLYSVGVTFS